MKHVQSIIVIVIVAVFTDVVILCCRLYRLPFLPVAVFTVYPYMICKVIKNITVLFHILQEKHKIVPDSPKD